MAILIEEQRDRGQWITIVIWLVIIVVIGFSAYYLFFKRPNYVEIAIPDNYKNTTELIKFNLRPDEVVNLPQFQALKQYVTVPALPSTGKANPFLGN